MSQKEPPPAPSIEALCFDEPLYVTFRQGPTRRWEAEYPGCGPPPARIIQAFPAQVGMYEGPVDRYCVECRRETVFLGVADEPKALSWPKVFCCQRDDSHRVLFYFLFGGVADTKTAVVTKIGQWPSLKDLQAGALGAFRKELGDEFGHELATAIGLASHGVGIGSFVYLRRIFESLLREAEARAVAAGLSAETLNGLRTVERIKTVSAYLPVAMVEHASLYGILSKHIHELSENECKENFGLVRQGIEMILAERIEAKQKAAREEAFRARIGKLGANLKAQG